MEEVSDPLPCHIWELNYLFLSCHLRNIRTEDSAWGDDEDSLEHDYYNSIPGKVPPFGGVVDSRLKPCTALLGHIHSQPESKAVQVIPQPPASTLTTKPFDIVFLDT